MTDIISEVMKDVAGSSAGKQFIDKRLLRLPGKEVDKLANEAHNAFSHITVEQAEKIITDANNAVIALAEAAI